MNFAVAFARHFARLVHLLLHEPSNVDEQKGSLRALVTLSREGAVRLVAHDDTLTANELPIPSLLTGVGDLVALLERYDVASLVVDSDASAADLLGAARLLAGVVSDVAQLPVRPSVRLEIRRPLPTPSVREDEAAESAADAAVSPLDEIDRTTSAERLGELLETLVAEAEVAARYGDGASVLEILHRIVRRESELADFGAKRAFFIAFRRAFRPPVLRAVWLEVDREPARCDDALFVAARAGEPAAEVLIELLLASTDDARRRYLAALRELPAGVPVLVHMLGDARWTVARSAALLLGELKASEAEGPLMELQHHDDERVRHAATTALMRLGTPRSLPAIQRALADGAPQMRMLAAVELVARRPEGASGALLRALDAEEDDEVRAAFLLALGRLGTPDAVERLIAAARPERGLLKRKMPGLRVAAIQALADAGTPEALEALRTLRDDRDEDVRASARYALSEPSGPSPA